VGANFLSLLRAVKKQIPLPLASIKNKRSLIFVKNLASFIDTCLQNPLAYNQTFLVSDDHDLSTPELLRQAALAMQLKARLLPFPVLLLELSAKLLGKKSISDRLCLSLQVDSSKAHKLLGWKAPYTVQQGLQESVATLENIQGKTR
ncbi:MAG: NAD-dependent dehydratase, partial [Burkholderiales bacterium]|nr:NAD-dependent dehydratase [Burkholderiales bacterium]